VEASKKTEKEATYRLLQLLDMYNKGELRLQENGTSGRRNSGEQYVECYLAEWIERYKYNVSVLTYNAYKTMITARIIPYFQPLKLPLCKVTGEDINDFYNALRDDGLTGATAQRYHSMMHLAFKKAVKQKMIASNPCEDADRPKATQYMATYYNAE
ncbi:MAG: phage integrase SAM-like domain-containing protein, partial [Clostridia bacterium]|nr:phage integrase SAM-like domain-containing protein [Clostridia bacterium]